MSVHSRIAELKRRHQDLSKEVEAAQRAPAADDLVIADMKKRKLALKEEIGRLQAR